MTDPAPATAKDVRKALDNFCVYYSSRNVVRHDYYFRQRTDDSGQQYIIHYTLLWRVPDGAEGEFRTGKYRMHQGGDEGPFPENLEVIRAAVEELCHPRRAARFERSDLQRLYDNAYSDLEMLEIATRDGLTQAGLKPGLIDAILAGQKGASCSSMKRPCMPNQTAVRTQLLLQKAALGPKLSRTLLSCVAERQEETAGKSAAGQEGLKLVVTFKMSKKERFKTFTGVASWEDVRAGVEELFPDLQVEDYEVRAGKLLLGPRNWSEFVAGKKSVTVGVISLAKAFSSFNTDDAYRLLHTALPNVVVDDSAFPLADFDGKQPMGDHTATRLGLQTAQDVIDSLGKELALRCFQYPALDQGREASRRELISPLLYAAAILSGEIGVMAEFGAKGTLARGTVDYALLYQKFCIVVVEGKLYDKLEDHLGQLAAEMRTVREEYCRTQLGKRKHAEEGDFAKVPSFGILSTGDVYVFYKYLPESRSFLKCSVMRLLLVQDIGAQEAAERALPVVRRLLQTIADQKQSMQRFKRSKN